MILSPRDFDSRDFVACLIAIARFCNGGDLESRVILTRDFGRVISLPRDFVLRDSFMQPTYSTRFSSIVLERKGTTRVRIRRTRLSLL